MGKKGSKRKTRWRTLSIGAPPGEEDEEGALRNGYATKGQENDSTTTHSFDRNGQTGYKPRRTGTCSSGATSYGNNGTRLQKEESANSPSQPKIIFNEDEYTRITTPRQDVLFKKGYLSRKKPWAGNASTSATPSTTESQSASHSTADGSETTEDQQLLDRDSGTGEYAPIVEPGAQLGYGTFYDHASGYYYEYPVMLVGPAPIPAPVGPSVLAAVPCGPVPLRPIEWINPAFVPKLDGQPYCVMDYQGSQNAESSPAVGEQVEESVLLPAENSNGTCNENGTGSASCNGSITGETEEKTEDTKDTVKEKQQAEDDRSEESHQQQQLLPNEEHRVEEQLIEEQHLENGMNGGPYLEPVLMQQPVHVSHVLPTVPQPYMYPGHYMFGPPLVNVNGVTIQSGPMIRTTDVAAMTAACAKRRKKKKRRKQRRPALGNAEDEEEGEYSSECDNGIPSSRLPWTACPTSTTTTTTTTNRPLNPECQEFQLRTVVESQTSLSLVPISDDAPTSAENSIVNQSSALSSDGMVSVNRKDETCNGPVSNDMTKQENELTVDTTLDQVMESSPLESSQLDNEADRLTSSLTEKGALSTNETKQIISGAWTEDEAPPSTDVKRTTNDLSGANEMRERSRDGVNGINISSTTVLDCPQENFVNGKTESDSNDVMRATSILLTGETMSRSLSPLNGNTTHDGMLSRSSTLKSISTTTTNNVENHQPQQNHESSNGKTSIILPKRKYSMKGLKFVREPTPGPDLESVTNVEVENDKVTVCDITREFDSIDLSNGSPYSKQDSITMIENSERSEDKVLCDFGPEVYSYDGRDKGGNYDLIEGSNEDSGFESQTRRSEYPITEAVTEWLRKTNSPNIFTTSAISLDSNTEDEDELDEKPPKNLQGNPMPALSANSDADNLALSRTISCGEFARTSNIKIEQVEVNGASAVSRKKRDVKGTKRKSAEKNGRRIIRNNDDIVQNDAVSSSDSCSQKEESIRAARKKHLLSQDVDEFCEFTEKDSVAGMRVASSSRIDSKRVSARRTKRLEKFSQDPVGNVNVKMRRIEDADNENDEGIVEDTVSVRTFEKGEIIVSEDGKLLTTSSLEPILYKSHNASTVIKTVCKTEYANENKEKSEGNKRNSSSEEDGSAVVSLESIEEPDVLECWEAETIEPVITPKRMLQSQGVLCEGEAAEEDNFEVEQANIEHVEKYYRLARGSATSIEEETSEQKKSIISSTSRTVPNSPEEMIESFCSEEIPVVVQNRMQKDAIDEKKIPIDEAFEVYESCYTGKAQFLDIDSKIFKPRTLYGQEGEGPIPCRAVCCNIQ